MMTPTKPANQNQNQPQTRANATAQPAPTAQPVQPAANVATETKPQPPAVTMPEAPYSGTVKVIDANGFEWLHTARALTWQGYIERVHALQELALKENWTPAPALADAPRAAPSSAPANADPAAPLCGIHGTPMEWRETKRGAFWSCPQKFANGDFCNYRPPKQ